MRRAKQQSFRFHFAAITATHILLYLIFFCFVFAARFVLAVCRLLHTHAHHTYRPHRHCTCIPSAVYSNLLILISCYWRLHRKNSIEIVFEFCWFWQRVSRTIACRKKTRIKLSKTRFQCNIVRIDSRIKFCTATNETEWQHDVWETQTTTTTTTTTVAKNKKTCKKLFTLS